MNQALGAYLRAQRLAAGLTQAQLATRAGVARPNVAAIEAGRRPASTDMANRLLDAIRDRPPHRRKLELSPPVLLNIELANGAAGHIAPDPERARTAMIDRLAQLRSHDEGSSATWLDDWDGILSRWNLGEVMTLLISTDPDDVERRKVSPLDAVLSPPEREDASRRARKIWRAARRVS